MADRVKRDGHAVWKGGRGLVDFLTHRAERKVQDELRFQRHLYAFQLDAHQAAIDHAIKDMGQFGRGLFKIDMGN